MRVIKFCISFLAIQSARAFSMEKPTLVINTTDSQFSPQPVDLPVWFINSTWADCDKNESIAYCDELIAKNQTNSTTTCFEEKGCCLGNSSTGFVTCPPNLSIEGYIFYAIGIIFPAAGLIRSACYASSDYTQLQKQRLITVMAVFLTISGSETIYFIQATHNGENATTSGLKLATSIVSGVVAGSLTMFSLRCADFPKKTQHELELIQEANLRR